jgi:hypothetical protein
MAALVARPTPGPQPSNALPASNPAEERLRLQLLVVLGMAAACALAPLSVLCGVVVYWLAQRLSQ